jgi:lysophospholipase L1-like esterase
MRLAEIVLLATSLLVGLVGIELGFRAWNEVPVFAWIDFRHERNLRTAVEAYAEYDPLLGWKEKPHWIDDDGTVRLTTIEEGIRSNGDAARPVPEGAILAVGDSFTEGLDVNDDETWPARLEAILGEPVINAGVGGYGVDQSVLRAERLIERYRPWLVLLGVFEDDILRAGFKRYEKPKPYFTVGNGALVHHNDPVPLDSPESRALSWWKRPLAYSHVADVLMNRFDSVAWSGIGYETSGADPVDVSCRLLARLEERTAAAGIDLVVVLQHGAAAAREGARPAHAEAIIGCAESLGIHVIDEFESLQDLIRSNDADVLRDLYAVRPDGVTPGHMSAKGNRHIAELIADTLRRLADDTPPSAGQP